MWRFNCKHYFHKTNDCDPVYAFQSYILTFNIVLLISSVAVGSRILNGSRLSFLLIVVNSIIPVADIFKLVFFL